VKIYESIVGVEKAILVLIAGFTVYAVGLEMYNVILARSVKLTDLLLLFIYAEVLGMVAGFYKNREIPITIPIFIAITALSRLIILQGKEINAINLIYESGAVLLLAIAFNSPIKRERFTASRSLPVKSGTPIKGGSFMTI
jgi:protein PsiE